MIDSGGCEWFNGWRQCLNPVGVKWVWGLTSNTNRSTTTRSLQPSIRCSTITTDTNIGGTLRHPRSVNRSANTSSGNRVRHSPCSTPPTKTTATGPHRSRPSNPTDHPVTAPTPTSPQTPTTNKQICCHYCPKTITSALPATHQDQRPRDSLIQVHPRNAGTLGAQLSRCCLPSLKTSPPNL